MRGAQVSLAGAEQLRTLGRHRDQLEVRQRIGQRHRHGGAALAIECDLAFPQQHRLEVLPVDRRGIAPAAACRHRLLAIVALAHDLHLRGRGRNLEPAFAHHGFEHIPRLVGLELQQRFIDRDESHFGAARRAAVGLGHGNRDIGGLAHRIAAAFGLDLNPQPVAFPADFHFGHADPVARFGQVNCRGGGDLLLVADRHAQPLRQLDDPAFIACHPPAHRHDRDIDVGREVGGQLDFDHRVGAFKLGHEAFEHAFALDRDQRIGFAERHADLEAGNFAGLVFGLFGDHVHPVAVVAAEPPVLLAGQPDLLNRQALAARIVAHTGHDGDFARDSGRDLAGCAAKLVGGGAAAGGELLDLFLVVIGIEAADQPPPRGDHPARIDIDLDLAGGERLPVEPQNDSLEPQVIVAHQPAVGLHPHLQRSRVERQAAAGGERFAIGIGIVHLDHQADRIGDLLADRNVSSRGAIGAQRYRQGLGEGQVLAGHVLGPVTAQRAGAFLDIGPAEIERLIAARQRDIAVEIGPHGHRQGPGPAARKIADEQRQRH